MESPAVVATVGQLQGHQRSEKVQAAVGSWAASTPGGSCGHLPWGGGEGLCNDQQSYREDSLARARQGYLVLRQAPCHLDVRNNWSLTPAL